MVAGGGWGADETSGLAIERRPVAAGAVLPRAFGVRHETNLVDSVAIVEAGGFDHAMLEAELAVERRIEERIAVARSIERDLEQAPTLDGVSRIASGAAGLCGGECRPAK